MSKSTTTFENLQSDLWTASCQIRALGELLLHQDSRQAAIDEAEVWHGYGPILREISEKLDVWSQQLDDKQTKQPKKKPKRRK